MAPLPALLAAALVSNLGGLSPQVNPQDAPLLTPQPLEVAQVSTRTGVLTTRFSGSWVNVRRQPSLRSPVDADGRSGARVTILRQSRGLDDSYEWYFVELPDGARGWVREDLVREGGRSQPVAQPRRQSPRQTAHVAQGSPSSRPPSNPSPRSPRRANPIAPTPSQPIEGLSQAPSRRALPAPPRTTASRRGSQAGPATGGALPRVSVPRYSPHARSRAPWRQVARTEAPAAPAPSQASRDRPQTQISADAPRPSQQATVPVSAPASYSSEEINYFKEVALGSEFGNASPRIRKWDGPVTIRVHGSPTRADRAALTSIVQELDDILGQSTRGQVSVTVLEAGDRRDANVDLYFVPHTEFSRYEPNYRAGNLGFAYVNWNNDKIYKARVLVTSTTDITQAERSHLIREELTQSMGLLRDSMRYSDSIFYQGWTSTTDYSRLDRAVIEMLYNPAIEPGMDGGQVETALRNLAPMMVGGR